MQKYGTDRQAIDDNILRRMRFACWITKATKTHVILIALPLPQWFRQTRLKDTFTRTLSVLL